MGISWALLLYSGHFVGIAALLRVLYIACYTQSGRIGRGCFVCRRLLVRLSSEVGLICTVQVSLKDWTVNGEGGASESNLSSLTPFYGAGCGRLQLGFAHWDTSVDYCSN